MACNWFYVTGYAIFSAGTKATKRSTPGNLTQWIIIQSKGSIRKGVGKVIKSVQEYSR